MKSLLWFVLAVALIVAPAANAQQLELKPGDHICIVGNTLAERMQHYGWLETLIHARFPEHNLVIRNLGYSGDEIDGWKNPQHRMRSMSFGSHDEWLSGNAPCPQPKKLSPRDAGKVRENRFELTNTRADVIFAFYGYNESWAGEAGLPKFKENVEDFIKHTLAQKYNGKSAPRLVLFSPIAHEFLNDPNLPSQADVEASNARLKMYSEAMGQIAKANGVLFVDLFTPMLASMNLRMNFRGNGQREEVNKRFAETSASVAKAEWEKVLMTNRKVPGAIPVAEVERIRLHYVAAAIVALSRTPSDRLTINGIHINEAGDKAVSQIAAHALWGEIPQDDAALKSLRAAVLDKNFYWFNRYRVTDGYSTYGDRAFLKFSEGPGGYGDGLSNYSVGQRELEVLDVMTSNRDKVIWAAAQGKTIKPDDSNIPEFIPVISNKPGELPGGKHKFLSGEEAIEKMTVGKGLKVELFADEKMFPELVNPVQMAFDTKGRLWVAAWRTYPHWKPTEPMNDKLLILEDTNGDGKADVCKTFAGDIHNPTGFEFWNGGVLLAAGPDLLFLKDTNGDDKYDIKERIVHGFDTADTHHTINSFTLDPGGALYMQEGTFHHSQIETPWGPPRRVANGAVFRYEPRQQKTDIYVTFGFANPHGHVFDPWGQDIVCDGTGANPFHAPLFSSHLEFPHKHNRPPQIYQQRTRPLPAIEILNSSHFPEEFRNNLLVPNVIGFQGILRYKLEDKDSSLGATELEPIVFSSDPNFRPADVEVGPDGAIYFTDWQNPIIGHMQHNLRDPNRDQEHGRVYRVRYAGRPLAKPLPIAGESLETVFALLKSDDDRVRYRARIELSGRPSKEVIAYATTWLAALEPHIARNRENAATSTANARELEHLEHVRLEGLWLHQHHNSINVPLLERVLKSSDFRVRAAALRVLAAWRDDLLGLPANLPSGASVSHAREQSHRKAIELLLQAAADPAPRVRLMALWAASFIPKPEAYEVLLVAAEYPTDQYLDFLSKEVARTLQPLYEQAKKEGREVAFATEAGARFALKNLPTDELLKQDKTKAVCLELLYRPGLQDTVRREAVRTLAKLDNKPELRVVMDAIGNLDARQQNADTTVIFDLVRQLTGRSANELKDARTELEKLATGAKQPIFRQIGYVSLINVDDNVDAAWKLATTDVNRLVDFINAMPLISDPGVRATLYDRVEPLLNDLPEELKGTKGTRGTEGRFVRVELPRKGTLTLSEVEVFSGGVNIARQGRATQKNTAHGGDASKAIDGGTGGIYGSGNLTHTEENTSNPWWEVDLGDEFPIDSIVIWNRTEGDLGNRLDGFTLRILDARRSEVWKQEKNPAPKRNVKFDLPGGGGKASQVRRAAMQALTYVRGQEPKTFATLAKFVKDGVDRTAAIRALQRLPRATWPKESAPELIAVLLDSLQKTPAAERTSDAALDQFEFADALASLLPADQAKAIRAQLGELGVRVIKIGTVFEKMSYDKDIIVVQAGKPVEFVLENSDLMPHNLVITLPGALEEIGLLSEANAQKPGFAEQHYIPTSPKILAKSTLLQPRDTQRLSFQVPQQPGVYPIVCTYPGHWRRMYAALYVVPDLDAYQAAPDEYLAAHKIGKQLFTVANCVGCHKIGDIGKEFGPDLLKLDAKLKPSDILKEILDPSAKINEKYQTNVFELQSGQVIQGLVVEESGDIIKVVENPLISTVPKEINRNDVADRVRSKTSIMPKGLLEKLTRDEILDLVAFIVSRNNKDHAIFKASHDH
jgi:putative heme-binding domain-containing protein